MMNDCAANRGSDLKVRKVKWRVEDVERAVTEFVVGKLGLLERILLMDYGKRPGVGAAPSA